MMNSTIDLKQSVEDSFKIYSGMVIKERALVDARDCLKPAARMLMYAQKIEKLTWDKPIQKSIKSVSAGLSHFYVHGDGPAYSTLARLGKPFAMRYPLEEFQGSFGTMIETGDEASSRYTEMRLAPIAKYLFDTIDKKTIDKWIDNYDSTEKYPSVLPSIGFYNFVNGTTGIGVAVASSIPSFCLSEVNESIIKIIRNPNISFDEIYCVPDFPTGATIINPNEVKESLRTGNGKACKLRATIKYIPDEHLLKVIEMPYGVYTSTIVEQLAKLTSENEKYGIKRINDLTGTQPLIEIELEKGINPSKMISKLYKDTSLEYHFGINMVMLDNGKKPRVFSFKEALETYISHIRICKRRELEYDLAKLLAREHILDGLIIAVQNIDDVVEIIKKAKDSSEAKAKLMSRFSLDEDQTKAILDLKLQRITNLEVFKLQTEKEEIGKEISRLNHLLNDSSAFDELLISILNEVASKFGDSRRTKVINLSTEESTEPTEVLPEKDIVILGLSNSTLRILPAETLKGSGRARKGSSLKLPKDITVTDTLYTTDQGTLSVLTSRGRIYSTNLRELEPNNDYSLFDIFKLQDNERVIKIIDGNQLTFNEHIIFVTVNGTIKKGLVSDLNNPSSKGKAALKLRENDYIVDCFFSNDAADRIVIVSSTGHTVFFEHGIIAATGTASIGVKGIKLDDNAYVIGAGIVKSGIKYTGVLAISSSGRGKVTDISELSTTSRAVKGNILQKTDADEILLGACVINENTKSIHILNGGKLVTVDITQIPIQARATLGVKLMNLTNNNEINIIQGE